MIVRFGVGIHPYVTQNSVKPVLEIYHSLIINIIKYIINYHIYNVFCTIWKESERKKHVGLNDVRKHQ